jgi:hypothetical protein
MPTDLQTSLRPVPAGLHQHQVAAHILGQCGDRLKAKTRKKETEP